MKIVLGQICYSDCRLFRCNNYTSVEFLYTIIKFIKHIILYYYFSTTCGRNLFISLSGKNAYQSPSAGIAVGSPNPSSRMDFETQNIYDTTDTVCHSVEVN